MRNWAAPRSTAPVVLALLIYTGCGSPRAMDGASDPAGPTYEHLPPEIDPSRRYLFYLHGRIVELQGRYAVSRVHGRYDYDGIVRSLIERGFVVISEVRPPDTRVNYAEKLAQEIRTLMAAGVPPEHITVAGFSKGGFLTMAASAALGHPKVNFVIMAGCGIGPWRREILQDLAPRMQGRILSLYDVADQEAGSCQEALHRAPGVEYTETALKTGRGHGLFYAAREAWIDLVSGWATGRR